MADRKNILSGNGEQLSQEEILGYLYNRLSEEERQLIEQKLVSDPFEADAIEGLADVDSEENIEKHLSQLRGNLHQITARKKRREKDKINIFEWTLLAALILLFLCVVAFLIITLYHPAGSGENAGVFTRGNYIFC